MAAIGQPRSIIAADQTVSFKVKFKPAKGATYLMTVDVNDRHGQHSKRTVALVTPTAVTTPAKTPAKTAAKK